MIETQVIFRDDMKGLDSDICGALTFDLVKPIKIEGRLENYSGAVKIQMDNGDVIEMFYEHPTTHLEKFDLTQQMSINDGVYVELGNEEPLQDLMRQHYESYLKERLRTRNK